jgi:hypothetical protein
VQKKGFIFRKKKTKIVEKTVSVRLKKYKPALKKKGLVEGKVPAQLLKANSK